MYSSGQFYSLQYESSTNLGGWYGRLISDRILTETTTYVVAKPLVLIRATLSPTTITFLRRVQSIEIKHVEHVK